jgi:hypothetical protein
MATAKNINRSTDPNVRKSPPLSANAFPIGHVAKGNDGNYWIINEDGNGIKRWVKVNKTASKSSSTKSSTSQTASSSPTVETQQEALDRYNTYIDKTSKIYYTLPKTNIVVYVEDKLNILKYQILIGNNIIVDENDPDFKKQLMDWLSQRIVIKNATIFSGGRNDITDLSFEFNLHASSFEIIDELNLLDDFLYIKMNVRNGKQLPDLTQSSSTSSNNPSKFKEYDLLLTVDQDNKNFYDLNFITSVIKDPGGLNNYWIEFKQCVARAYTGGVWESDLVSGFRIIYSYIPQIGDIIALKYSGNPDLTIQIVNIDLPNNEIEVESSASGSTNRYYTKEQFNTLLIERGIQVLNFDPNTRVSNIPTSVQQAETKVDDIVFNAPVVPVGTEDQRNATDKLVDEFIAKNENNLKKLAVENVGLLSTIDKTLEFIKAKFGTPAAVTSVSNAVNTASQPVYPDNIDDYKLIQFIGDDGERKVIEFKKFKTGKSASVFKYFIGDVFLIKDASTLKNNIYVKITGAKEKGTNEGDIQYIESYLGNIDRGLTWSSRVINISVSEFDGYIEDGFWVFVPGANQNLNKISSAVSNASTSANRSFQVGDKVRIKKSSQYYIDGDDSNPKDTQGIIEEIYSSSIRAINPINVKWDNGVINAYEKDDLELVSNANRSFELGDVVKIKSDSQFFGSNTSNPANVEGVVIDIVKGKSKAFPIRVKWANGKENTYPKDDLFFVSKSVASAPAQAPVVTTTASGSAIAGVGDTVIFFASREKTNLQGIVKAIVTGTDGKPYLRINVNGKFYLKQQGSVKKV